MIENYIRVHPVFLHSTRAKEKTKNSDRSSSSYSSSSSSLEKIEFEARNITDFLKNNNDKNENSVVAVV